jgi:hypothetical protein
MAKFAIVREFKKSYNLADSGSGKGKAMIVTRRGKPVATFKAFEQKTLRNRNVIHPAPTII